MPAASYMRSYYQCVMDTPTLASPALSRDRACLVPVMSLLNAWILPAEAIIAVDTDGVGDEGERMPSSKMLLVPHLNAVLALRGQLALLSYLFTRALSGSFDSFDELEAAT